MTLFKNDKILFSYPIILKGTLLALIFPFLVVIIVNLRDGKFSLRTTLLFFSLIALPLLFIQVISIIRRCRYTLKEISIDEDNKTITIIYWDYHQKVTIESKMTDFTILIRHDNWMKYAYVLEFRKNGRCIFKQCEESFWTDEKMFDLIRMVSDNSVNCKFDTIDLKQKFSDH